MKVLQVINSLKAGGAEKLLVDSIIKYEQKGIDVDLLLLYGAQTEFLDDLQSRSNIRIIRLSQNSFVYNPLLIFNLRKHLKNYDLVHVHLFPSLYWVSLAKLFNNGKYNLILTEHSSNNKRRNHRILRAIDKFVYKQYNKIITISQAVDHNLKQHLGSHFGNISLIHNGIDLNVINTAIPYTKESLSLKPVDKVIIQVSSFRYPKDQETVIRALEELPDHVKLLLVGEGPNQQKCKILAENLDLKNRVKFLGIRTDVPNLLKTADIVILSSHYEGLSLSSVEGMASGKPFVSTDAPGLSEVVKNAGILFAIGDAKLLAQIITSLLEDPEYYKQVSKACLERSKAFDMDEMINSYIDLYKSL